MANSYIERRIVSAGADLCKRRIHQKGSPITADDIRDLKVKTFSPVLQSFYFLTGLGFMVFGIWVHYELRNMALSFVPVLVGFGNMAFAIHGRPRKVRELQGVDIMGLSAEIVKRFVGEMDAKREQADPPERPT